MLNKTYKYCVIGASNNSEKYGYKVLKNLIDKGLDVTCVNPKEEEILGIKCYKSHLDIEADIFIFLVPGGISMKIVKDFFETKKVFKKLWFQPGSFDNKVIGFCRRFKMKFVKDSCIMLEQVLE